MAERKKRMHPIQALRIALGLSRARFAAALGAPAWEATIEATEYGTRSVFLEIPNAIMLRFGIDAASLHVGKDEKWLPPRSATTGQILKSSRQIRECVSVWEGGFDDLERKVPKTFEVHLLPKLQQLIQAASTKPGTGIALLLSLDEWINKAISDLGLRFAVRRSESFDERLWRPILENVDGITALAHGSGWVHWTSTPKLAAELNDALREPWLELFGAQKQRSSRRQPKGKSASKPRRPSASRAAGNAEK